jgi:hypothetical protein
MPSFHCQVPFFCDWATEGLLDITLYKVDRHSNRIYDVRLLEGDKFPPPDALYNCCMSGDIKVKCRIAGGKVERGDNDKHLIVTVYPGSFRGKEYA